MAKYSQSKHMAVGNQSDWQVVSGTGYSSKGRSQRWKPADSNRQILLLTGALVGPPWSKRENGYVIREQQPGGVGLFYEPHCDCNPADLPAAVGEVDVVITAVVNQNLGAYPLVRYLFFPLFFPFFSRSSAPTHPPHLLVIALQKRLVPAALRLLFSRCLTVSL